MKRINSLIVILLFAFAVCNNSWGQKVIQKETVVTLYGVGIDYGDGVGYVTGTYKYHFTLHLSKDGYIQSIHWNATDFNLRNEAGNWVKIIDSGHDSYGFIWDFWNNKDAYNAGFNISYDIPDGWLSEWMPEEMPDEGTFVDMSCKILCKGKIIDWSFMVQLHMNANGEITADVVKP
jgi:hypothetical protein